MCCVFVVVVVVVGTLDCKAKSMFVYLVIDNIVPPLSDYRFVMTVAFVQEMYNVFCVIQHETC